MRYPNRKKRIWYKNSRFGVYRRRTGSPSGPGITSARQAGQQIHTHTHTVTNLLSRNILTFSKVLKATPFRLRKFLWKEEAEKREEGRRIRKREIRGQKYVNR